MALITDCVMAVVLVLGTGPVLKDTTADLALPTKVSVRFALVFFLGRTGAFADNQALLQSTTPHHPRVILVRQELHATGPQTERLRDAIVETQREENVRMQPILEDY